MIEVRGVSKSYGKVQALDNVWLTIDEGSCFGLIGPNGAGKSTLMKILVGVLQQFEGDIQIGPLSVKRHRQEVKQKLGYVPQEICLEESLTARENLILFGRLYGLSGAELKERIDHVLRLIGLKEQEKERIFTFSGGMKRRLNIGCALLHEPEIIVLDEPTVGIDPQSRRAIFALIQKLKAEGSTIIYVSHYMEEVERLCDSVGFIDRGHVVESGPLKQVLAKHRKPALFVSGLGITRASLTPFGETKEREGGFIVESDDVLSTLEEMIACFQREQLVPQRLELSQLKLEEIFFKLTGTQLREKGRI